MYAGYVTPAETGNIGREKVSLCRERLQDATAPALEIVENVVRRPHTGRGRGQDDALLCLSASWPARTEIAQEERAKKEENFLPGKKGDTRTHESAKLRSCKQRHLAGRSEAMLPHTALGRWCSPLTQLRSDDGDIVHLCMHHTGRAHSLSKPPRAF